MDSFLFALLVTGVPIFLLATITELFWRKKKFHGELSRKFLHITVGCYAAFWPWFISWRNIELLAFGAFCALVVSRKFNIYKSMHMQRWYGTGELLATISVGLAAVLTHDKYLFAASILTLSVADGFAAVAGTLFGKHNTYKVFGQQKSFIGTLTFIILAFGVLGIYFAVSGATGAWPAIIWIPIILAIVENASMYGTDNLFVPLITLLLLKAI